MEDLSPNIRTMLIQALEERSCIRRRNKYIRNLCASKMFEAFPTVSHRKVFCETRRQLQEFLKANPAVTKFWWRQRKVEALLRNPDMNQEQRTAEWFAKRERSITASIVGDIIRGPAGRYRAMMAKLRPTPRKDDLRDSPEACRHGILLEDIVKEYWASLKGVKVMDGGCISHSKFPRLAASPDGIVDVKGVKIGDIKPEHGRLIEIKCPMTREIKPDKVMFDYYHQMQMQMECLGLDECSFLEFKVSMGKISSVRDFLRADTGLAKGYLLMNATMSERKGWKIYLPGDPIDAAALAALAEDPELSVTYWVLEKLQEQVVKHDVVWLATYRPIFEEFWLELEAHRRNGTLPTPPPEVKKGQGAYLDLTGMTIEEPEPRRGRMELLPENPFT